MAPCSPKKSEPASLPLPLETKPRHHRHFFQHPKTSSPLLPTSADLFTANRPLAPAVSPQPRHTSTDQRTDRPNSAPRWTEIRVAPNSTDPAFSPRRTQLSLLRFPSTAATTEQIQRRGNTVIISFNRWQTPDSLVHSSDAPLVRVVLLAGDLKRRRREEPRTGNKKKN